MLIDTHCHPDGFVRGNRFDAVLARAGDAGVAHMVCAGTEPEDWGIYRELCRQFPQKISYAVGLHPGNIAENWQEQLAALDEFLSAGNAPAPIAIGEIGLDEYRMPAEPELAQKIRETQLAVFSRQLATAARLGLPVVVHARNAFDAAVRAIDESGVAWGNVVFHCFSESAERVKILNARGGRASFTGTITYKNAQQTRDAALAQGLGKLMLETDCPYLAPCKLRGKENEPAYLRETAKFVAELFGVSVAEIEDITTDNARRFYRLPA